MYLNTIQPSLGSRKKSKRVGRGIGCTLGKTCGRGHKGQKSRSGGFHKVGFEGGQMPLQRRVPKFGFKNINRIDHQGINLDVLQKLIETKKIMELTPEILILNGLAHKNDLIKILGRGELTTKVNVTAHAFTATAKAAIEKLGGTVIIL